MVPLAIDAILGVAFLAIPVLIIGLGLRLVRRLRGADGLGATFAKLILRPRLRRRLLREISAMALILVAGLMLSGVALVLPIAELPEEVGLSAVFLSGTVVVLLMEIEGIRSYRLTLGDELELRDARPTLAAALAEVATDQGAVATATSVREPMYVPPRA